MLKTFSFQEFEVLDSTCFSYSNILAPAISSRYLLRSIGKVNLHLGPLQVVDRILESVIILKSPVTICPAG